MTLILNIFNFLSRLHLGGLILQNSQQSSKFSTVVHLVTITIVCHCIVAIIIIIAVVIIVTTSSLLNVLLKVKGLKVYSFIFQYELGNQVKLLTSLLIVDYIFAKPVIQIIWLSLFV